METFATKKQTPPPDKRIVMAADRTGLTHRVGTALLLPDGSISILLDAIPLDGRLTIPKP